MESIQALRQLSNEPRARDTAQSHSSYAGKPRLISVVFSLETGICDTQTHKFNQEATKLGGDVVVLTISADLPFTQKRWCGASGLENVITLSDHKDMCFVIEMVFLLFSPQNGHGLQLF